MFKTVINNPRNNDKSADLLLSGQHLRFMENYPDRGFKEGSIADVYCLDDNDVVQIYDATGTLRATYTV